MIAAVTAAVVTIVTATRVYLHIFNSFADGAMELILLVSLNKHHIKINLDVVI